MRGGKKQDEAAVVLMGSDETSNPEYDEYEGCDNVFVVSQLEQVFKSKFLCFDRESRVTKTSSQRNTNIGNGVQVAREMIRKRTERKKYTRRVVILTNLKDSSLSTLEASAEDLEGNPLIQYEFVVIESEGFENLSEYKRLVSFAAANENTGCAVMSGAAFAEKLIKDHQGNISATTYFQGPLHVGENLELHVRAYTKTSRKAPPSLKKMSKVVLDENSGAAVDFEQGKVKRNIIYSLPDKPDETVQDEDIIEGYRYGREILPIGGADAEAKKYITKKELSVMGFIAASAAPIWMNTGPVLVLEPTQGLENTRIGFSAFVRSLKATQRVAIARFVARDKGSLSIVALIPWIADDDTIELLFARQLPFEQDQRDFAFNSLKSSENLPSSEQLEAVDRLVSAMDLSAGVKDEYTGIKGKDELFLPEQTLNPFLERLFNVMEERIKTPECPIPKDSHQIKALFQPDPTMLRGAEAQLKKVLEMFPLEKKTTTKISSSKRKEPLTSDEGEYEAKKRKVATAVGLLGSSVSSSSSSSWFTSDKKIEKVGNVNPVEDYKTMLAYKDKDFSDVAFKGMTTQIGLLIGADGGPAFYPKAINCLTALRQGSIESSTENDFNTFLQELKATSEKEFWKSVRDAKITLVTSEEAVAVTDVSKEDADAFIGSEPEPIAPSLTPAVPAPPANDDDMDEFD